MDWEWLEQQNLQAYPHTPKFKKNHSFQAYVKKFIKVNLLLGYQPHQQISKYLVTPRLIFWPWCIPIRDVIKRWH